MQLELGNNYLHIQGFVSQGTQKEMAGSLTHRSGAEWFFVEYASVTYPQGASFPLIIDSKAGSKVPEFYNLRLIDIVDQFGFHQPEVSEGWKTICQFAFDTLPPAIAALPKLDTWRHNPEGVKIVTFSDVKVHDDVDISKKNYMLVVDELISWALHADPTNRKEFANSFSNIIRAHKDELQKKASPDFVRKLEETLHAI